MSDSRSHIQFALLADLVEQQRAPDAQVREHLATCAACARDLEWLTRVIGAMRADQTQAAPAEVVARAKRIFRAPTSAAARPSLRQRCNVLGLMFQRVASSFSFIIIFCMVDSVSG